MAMMVGWAFMRGVAGRVGVAAAGPAAAAGAMAAGLVASRAPVVSPVLGAAARLLHTTVVAEKGPKWTRNRAARWAYPRDQWPKIGEDREVALDAKITSFADGDDASLAMKVVPIERAWVHYRCGELGLKSRSEGKGNDRVLVVSRKPVIPQRVLRAERPPNAKKTPANADVLSSPTVPDFTPVNMQRNLLKTLELEEMYYRGKMQPKPKFPSGSIIRVTYQEARSRPTLRRMVGLVTATVNRGIGSSFTLRNVIEGMPFEMTFDTYHPLVYNVEVLELQRRRRAKLYYMRDRPDKDSAFSQNYKPGHTSSVRVVNANNKVIRAR